MLETNGNLAHFLAGIAAGGLAVGKIIAWHMGMRVSALKERRNQLREERDTAEEKWHELEKYKTDVNGLIATLARRAGLLKDKHTKPGTPKGESTVTNYDETTGLWSQTIYKHNGKGTTPNAQA